MSASSVASLMQPRERLCEIALSQLERSQKKNKVQIKSLEQGPRQLIEHVTVSCRAQPLILTDGVRAKLMEFQLFNESI